MAPLTALASRPANGLAAAGPSSNPRRRHRYRPGLRLSLLRATLGSADLVAPRLLAADLAAPESGGEVRLLLRVLGVRQLAQAALSLALPRASVLWLGVATDATHAASMLVLARLRPDWRRGALADAAVASLLAGLGAVAASSARAQGSGSRG
ncbi:MAG: hypothetical protein ACRENY_03000 [Candidatus Dormibacteria bacterium]